MTKQPKVLVVSGDGINCEEETVFILNQVGFEPNLIHVNNLLSNPQLLKSHQMLVLPGGFSFADEIASGKVLAIKLKDHLKDQLKTFVESGALLLGICNGFQSLVQMGILPESRNGSVGQASLVHNNPNRFINRWVELIVDKNVNCPFLDGLSRLELPMRHGEGQLSVSENLKEQVKQNICARYSQDVNGSFDRTAALINDKGNVMGIMPHPEAFVRWTQHPAWTTYKRKAQVSKVTHMLTNDSELGRPTWADRQPDGLIFFQNALRALA